MVGSLGAAPTTAALEISGSEGRGPSKADATTSSTWPSGVSGSCGCLRGMPLCRGRGACATSLYGEPFWLSCNDCAGTAAESVSIADRPKWLSLASATAFAGRRPSPDWQGTLEIAVLRMFSFCTRGAPRFSGWCPPRVNVLSGSAQIISIGKRVELACCTNQTVQPSRGVALTGQERRAFAANQYLVACMVNMTAELQLGFLGILGYSSLAEILATQIARRLQAEARGGAMWNKHGHRLEPTFLRENPTRSVGIIRATLTCELDGKMWFKLKLLPTNAPFEKMVDLLNELKAVKEETVMVQIVQAYRDTFGVVPQAEGIGDRRVEDTKIDKVEDIEVKNLNDNETKKAEDSEDNIDNQLRELAGRIADEMEFAWREVRNISKEV